MLDTHSNIVENMYIQTGILPLEKQFQFNFCTQMFKIFHRQAPTYLDIFFDKPNFRTRKEPSNLPKPRIDLFKTSLAFQGTSLWNSLPPYLKAVNTLPAFKMSLRQYLFSQN